MITMYTIIVIKGVLVKMKQDECRTTFPQFPESYWLASTDVPNFPKLNEDIQVDVAIVGAGITGITTAYLLSKKGLHVAVVDAGRILHGTTGHTTAKITAQHDLIYSEFLSHFGKEKTRLYYEANRDALEFIRQTVEEYHIDCQFTEEDAYVYTCADTHVEKINDEYKAYKELGIPGSYVEQTPLPFSTKAAIMMANQAQFNPIPFLRYLANQVIRQGGKIYEQTTVVGVDKGTPSIINTSDGHKITCNYVVSSSHFPFNDPNSLYFARLHAERSYVLAVKTDPAGS